MLKKFTEHPAEQNETYLQHMRSAWRIVYFLKILELKCIVHSIFPFLYKDALSSKIECLKKMTQRKEQIDEDLYEIYGGD
tara:strand:- start:1119 stop:1358 length:240 start_codon:yes stop_codon:yes gene_type:complete